MGFIKLSIIILNMFGMGAIRPAADSRAPRIVATFDEMPKVAALPDGRLMAFFHSLSGEVRDVIARTSGDGGKTWGKKETLFTVPDSAGAFGYTLVFIDR